MSRNLMHSLTLAGLAIVASMGTAIAPASAQATYADKATGRLVGKWIGDNKGRTIEFKIRDYNAVFEDEVEPGVSLSGAYRQDDSGAGYVLTYSKGFQCRYNVSVISGAEGNEINLRLVSFEDNDTKGRFKCIEGQLKRTR
ncbi:MAG: hypothetical protein WDN31_18130 [Hyphomicrobium sp.]